VEASRDVILLCHDLTIRIRLDTWRAARDVGRLQAIQLAAGDAFRHVGMSAVAESPPLTAESLSGYRKATLASASAGT